MRAFLFIPLRLAVSTSIGNSVWAGGRGRNNCVSPLLDKVLGTAASRAKSLQLCRCLRLVVVLKVVLTVLVDVLFRSWR